MLIQKTVCGILEKSLLYNLKILTYILKMLLYNLSMKTTSSAIRNIAAYFQTISSVLYPLTNNHTEDIRRQVD